MHINIVYRQKKKPIYKLYKTLPPYLLSSNRNLMFNQTNATVMVTIINFGKIKFVICSTKTKHTFGGKIQNY